MSNLAIAHEQSADHAQENGQAYMAEIARLLRVYQRCIQYNHHDWADNIRERIEEMPLSVLVRSAWHTPGAGDDEPGEYELLLSTGGPALRITGELNAFEQVETAELQCQDWFTPWRSVEGQDQDTLREFANFFWYGE